MAGPTTLGLSGRKGGTVSGSTSRFQGRAHRAGRGTRDRRVCLFVMFGSGQLLRLVDGPQ